MKASANYGHRGADGSLDAGPGPLPDQWEGHGGLRSRSDDELAALGWYPVRIGMECPKCLKEVVYRFDERGEVWIGEVPPQTLERARDGLRKVAQALIRQSEEGGFHYRGRVYSSRIGMMLPIFAALMLARDEIATLSWPVGGGVPERTTIGGAEIDDFLESYISHHEVVILPEIESLHGPTETLEDIIGLQRNAMETFRLLPRSGLL